MKQIVAFSGSTNPRSINFELLKPVIAAMPEYQVRLLELKDINLPVYSECLEKTNGIPGQILALQQEFSQADAFVFSTPEHNGLMPVFLKNIFDWMSRTGQKIFFQKPVFILSTSPGQNGGSTNVSFLRQLVPWWGAGAVFTYSLGNFYKNFDIDSSKISDEAENLRLEQEIQLFKMAVSNSETSSMNLVV